MSPRSRTAAGLVALALTVAACSSDDGGDGSDASASETEDASGAGSSDTDEASDTDGSGDESPESGDSDGEGASEEPERVRYVFPDPPESPPADEAGSTEADEFIDTALLGVRTGGFNIGSIRELARTGDARHAWFLSDLLRFFQRGEDADELVAAFETLTDGVSLADDPTSADSVWLSSTNHLIAWDTPAYPGYQEDKAELFLLLEPEWEPFFTDSDAAIDWRHLSWGGVFIDDRELGDPNPCPGGCIPSLDDPATTDADGGSWYPEERTVFGIEVNGEALAIPLNIAEVHEMFNLTLGGRRLGIPYCTLCGAAEAYFTDTVDGDPPEGADEVPVLRTSGLLSRSNKVMYDLRTFSVFDTFTGEAVSGPLQDAGVVLEETTVVRSTWAEWKADHPDTRIIAPNGGIGRTYLFDPLGGRDDDGPIFPIGDADARLDVQEFVVGVITDDGQPIAFPSDLASETIADGGEVETSGVRLESSGGGLVAVDADTGDALPAHEAFWFAWSQFHPDTELWTP
ncbi:MAG: DUF3179 domain-containing (seleno)protein [Actinomycetota bacterium]